MSQTMIPGYGVTLSVAGSTVVGLTCTEFEIDYGPATNPKPFLGAEGAGASPGQGTGTFSASGMATQEALPLLAAIRDAADNPVDYIATYWSGGDADTFSAVTRARWRVSAAGDVEWSLSGDLDGKPAYA